MLSYYFGFSIDTKVAEAGVFTQRIVYSPNGLSYHDPLSNKVYPGIIDLEKFNNPILDKSIF